MTTLRKMSAWIVKGQASLSTLESFVPILSLSLGIASAFRRIFGCTKSTDICMRWRAMTVNRFLRLPPVIETTLW